MHFSGRTFFIIHVFFFLWLALELQFVMFMSSSQPKRHTQKVRKNTIKYLFKSYTCLSLSLFLSIPKLKHQPKLNNPHVDRM